MMRVNALYVPLLHPIRGRARKCGPCALAAITGLNSTRCAAYLRLVTGRPQIHGVDDLEMDAALRLVGWRPFHHTFPADARPTLNRWNHLHHSLAYILVVPNHYLTVAFGSVADNGTYFSRQPRPLNYSPHLGLRVHAQIACLPPGAPVPPKAILFPSHLDRPPEPLHA